MEILEKLWPLLAPLMGVIIGGLITYFVTTSVERQKWSQQKRDKLDDARRQAIVAALGWLEPIDSAMGKAEMHVYKLLHGNEDEEEFRRSYPDLLSVLAKLDVTPEQYFLLPDHLYPMGHLYPSFPRNSPA